jgi:hypothetical protein
MGTDGAEIDDAACTPWQQRQERLDHRELSEETNLEGGAHGGEGSYLLRPT